MEQNVVQIPCSLLVFGKANVRRRVGDLSELKESIRQVGILQPVLVRPIGDGKYEVIAGRRRVTAARELGLGAVPAVIKEMENGDAVIASLTENIQRGDLDVDEEGEAYEHLCSLYGSCQEVARRVHKSAVHVQRMLDALTALRTLQRLAQTGESVPTVTAIRSRQEREDESVLPVRHASELQATWMAVRDEIPSQEQDRRYAALARPGQAGHWPMGSCGLR